MRPAAAAAELVWVLAIVVAVIGVAPQAARRGPRHAPASSEDDAGRFAAPPSTADRPLPTKSRRELPGGLHLQFHLHFHGVSAEDVAAILARQDLPQPEVNQPGPPHVP